MLQTVELKTAPEIKDILKRAIGYRKHTCFLSTFPSCGVDINSYWCEGSRDEFTLYDLATNNKVALPTNTHPFFDVARYKQTGETESILIDSSGRITLKMIPENVCLIRHGISCGKPATAVIYLNQGNLAKLLCQSQSK